MTLRLEDLERAPWNALIQPEWNTGDEAAKALRALATCASESQAATAYHRVLSSLGNDHAGTYYLVVLAAVPFLGRILEYGEEWPRVAALDVLVDLGGSFQPEAGFETVAEPNGETAGLRDLLHMEVGRLLPRLEELAARGTSARERELAREVLLCLAEGPPAP